jgi:5-methylcytosine-specific restriction endonuclease McrA
MGRTGKGGPTGRPWRRVRAATLAASDVCYLCGHPGSGAVDHVISRKERPDLALDPANLRPVHGSLSRCPWCHGRACNEVKGDRPGLGERQRPRQSRRW